MSTATPTAAPVVPASREPRTITLHRAARLAPVHSTTVARLFIDYPPLLASVDGDTTDDYARVPLSTVVVALGY